MLAVALLGHAHYMRIRGGGREAGRRRMCGHECFFLLSLSLALLSEERRWRGVALDSCKFHARTETDSAVCASLSRDSDERAKLEWVSE